MKAVVRCMAVAAVSVVVFGAAGAIDVSTAQQLVDAVNNNGTDGTEIVLAAGTYDLSAVPCSGAPGHMYAQKSVKLRGATGNPSDVIIKGDGKNRILYLARTGNEVRDITFRDGDCSGYAQNTSTEPRETRGGGAICIRTEYDESLVSNCVFIANKAINGGAVGEYSAWSGGNLASGRLIDCAFIDNTANGSGGAAEYPLLVLRCAFTNNSCLGLWDHGGALVSARRVENCDFYRNGRTAGSKGGALKLSPDITASAVATGCTFTENETSTYGGAVVAADNFAGALVTNCTFISNGTSSMTAGGAVHSVSNVIDCVFIGNKARSGGAAASSVLALCTLRNNAGTDGGGAYDCALDHCTVITNSASNYGGGAAGSGRAITGCLFAGNTGVFGGGGVSECYGVNGCRFLDNVAYAGGAARSSTLTGCYLRGNVSNYSSGGGAAHSSKLYFCTNTANRCTNESGTDGTATELRESYAEDCTFTGVGESIHPVFVRSYFNRCRIDSMTNNCNFGAFNWEAGLTNCLVTRANVKYLFKVNSYDNHNSAIVSCTFAENGYQNFNNVAQANVRERIDVVNCFFYGNRSVDGEGYDLDAYASYLAKSFKNCIFAAKEASYAPDSSTSLNYYGDASFRPGFVGPAVDPVDPYALRRTSPAVKRGGFVMDWMATATDLAANPRLRDNRVDIGCYQCWLEPTGSLLLFR